MFANVNNLHLPQLPGLSLLNDSLPVTLLIFFISEHVAIKLGEQLARGDNSNDAHFLYLVIRQLLRGHARRKAKPALSARVHPTSRLRHLNTTTRARKMITQNVLLTASLVCSPKYTLLLV